MENKTPILFPAVSIGFAGCGRNDNNAPHMPFKRHESSTQELINALEHNSDARLLLVKSITKAKSINPDHDTNPAQNLEEYYSYLDWSIKCMPWSILPQPVGRSLYDRIDQGIAYFYFILDIPLDELKDREDLYYPSIQYIDPFRTWIKTYHDSWALYLNSKDSWKQDYLKIVLCDPLFGVQNGWYENPSNWHSFNDFFSRRLSSPDKRPIVLPDDNSVVVSCADAKPLGIWKIDANGNLIQHKESIIKSRKFKTIDDLLGPESLFHGQFYGGTLIHTFLDVNDYHRYHFPIGGTIREIRKIQAIDASGGITLWDTNTKRYRLKDDIPGWQMLETRGLVIIETDDLGFVAVLPIGMSQINSVNFVESLKVGDSIRKGQEMGWFLFGGSAIVYLFQKGVDFELASVDHILQGEQLGTISRNK